MKLYERCKRKLYSQLYRHNVLLCEQPLLERDTLDTTTTNSPWRSRCFLPKDIDPAR